jgi:hypothetical protein
VKSVEKVIKPNSSDIRCTDYSLLVYVCYGNALTNIHASMVVSVSACHAGDRGPIPHRLFFLISLLVVSKENTKLFVTFLHTIFVYFSKKWKRIFVKIEA